MTDPTLQRATRGDRAALLDLLERNLPRLQAYVRARAGRHLLMRESRSDLVQSVCREALEDLDSFEFRDEVSFRHWLCKVAWRKLADRGRMLNAAARDPRREVGPAEIPGGGAGDEPVARELVADPALRSEVTPSRDASGREEWQRLGAALEDLPEDQREAILLHRIVGLEHAAIAQALGRSEGAVRNLVYRGLARVAARLRRDESG